MNTLKYLKILNDVLPPWIRRKYDAMMKLVMLPKLCASAWGKTSPDLPEEEFFLLAI